MADSNLYFVLDAILPKLRRGLMGCVAGGYCEGGGVQIFLETLSNSLIRGVYFV